MLLALSVTEHLAAPLRPLDEKAPLDMKASACTTVLSGRVEDMHAAQAPKKVSGLWGDPVDSKVCANTSVGGGNQAPANAPAAAPLFACDIHRDMTVVGAL